MSADLTDDNMHGGVAVAAKCVETKSAVAVGATAAAGKEPVPVMGGKNDKEGVPAPSTDPTDNQVATKRRPRDIGRPRRRPGARWRGSGGRVGGDHGRS